MRTYGISHLENVREKYLSSGEPLYINYSHNYSHKHTASRSHFKRKKRFSNNQFREISVVKMKYTIFVLIFQTTSASCPQSKKMRKLCSHVRKSFKKLFYNRATLSVLWICQTKNAHNFGNCHIVALRIWEVSKRLLNVYKKHIAKIVVLDTRTMDVWRNIT